MFLVNMGLERILKGALIGTLCLQGALVGRTHRHIPEFYSHSADVYIQAKVTPEKILENYFASKGFITGNIIIPELGVEVTLQKNQFYKKEEEVADVFERINEVRSQFGLPIPYHDYVRGYGWCGVVYAECSEKKAFGYIVLIKENLNDANKIYTSAHENGHFLWYIGKQEIIYQKFKKPNIVELHIHKNKDFAILCGWIAMKKAGYDLNDCVYINIKNPEIEKNLDRIKNLVIDHHQDKN